MEIADGLEDTVLILGTHEAVMFKIISSLLPEDTKESIRSLEL